MNDDQLDELLRREAQSYHWPPEAPREEMWQEIERARTHSKVVMFTSARWTRWVGVAAGIAAVLVLGIAIGRLSRGTESMRGVTSVASTSRAGADAAPPSRDSAQLSTDTVGEEASLPASGGSRGGSSPRMPGGRALATRQPAPPSIPLRGRSNDGAASGDMSAYRMAVVEHMARTEVLLTSFRAQSSTANRGQAVDAQFASLSRELLQTTRLLLATHNNEDPQLTHLLEDLELVLMQITQYVAEGRRGDLEAINQSLDRRGVLPKLRSSIPAGVSGT